MPLACRNLRCVASACLMGLCCSAAAAEPPARGLQVGDEAPDVAAVDETGQTWRLADRAAGKVVVLCFYPGDFGGGCARRAQTMRRNLEATSDQGALVVAISGDTPSTHCLFKAMHGLHSTLLSDESGDLAKRFGVPVGAGCRIRVTDREGRSALDPNGRFVIVRRPATLAPAVFAIGVDGRVVYKSVHSEAWPSREELAIILANESAP